MESKEIVRLRNLENTLAQFKQERKELEISIPYIESQIAELQKETCILPIRQGKRKPTIGIDMLTMEIVILKTGKVIPPPQATARKGKK